MNKNYLTIFYYSLVILLFVTGCSATTTNDNVLEGKVINVVDGDTIDVQLSNGDTERVRLVLVDTPETKHPKKPIQPFGPEAFQYTKDVALNHAVKLELDVQERDQYGRILAYVYIGNKMLNESLLKEGLARVSVYPPNTKYIDAFNTIQNKAQNKKIGIWSVENYVKENGFYSNEATPPSAELSKLNCEKPLIKGNITSKGEKIYHIPESSWYEQTKPEIWFCSVEEALQAGFRAPK